jgi:hypothetical protein
MRQILGREAHLAIYSVLGSTNTVNVSSSVSTLYIYKTIILRRIFQEVGCGGMDWIELAQVAGTCKCGNEPSVSIKCGQFLDKLQTG